MSKVLGKRNTSFQSINLSNNNPLKVKQSDIKSLIKNNNSMLYNNNNLFFSKHFSPSSNSNKTPSPINPKGNKKVINSHKKNNIIKLISSNSLNEIYPQNNILSPRIKQFIDKENTQPQFPKNILNDIQSNKK